MGSRGPWCSPGKNGYSRSRNFRLTLNNVTAPPHEAHFSSLFLDDAHMADRLRYVKSLDGIRGVGAVGVIAAHYGYLQCGWVVVQFFFVLSGYLITSILLAEKEHPFRQYLGHFYWRRILRIFPVYFGFLLICGIFYLLLKQPREFLQVLPSLLTYTYNFYLVPPGRSLSGIFPHLWSLSVEEQFYLLWPLLIFALTPRGARWMVVAILISIPLLRTLFVIAGALLRGRSIFASAESRGRHHYRRRSTQAH